MDTVHTHTDEQTDGQKYRQTHKFD